MEDIRAEKPGCAYRLIGVESNDDFATIWNISNTIDSKVRANRLVTSWNYHKDLLDLAHNVALGLDVDQGAVQRLVAEIDGM